MPRTRVADPEEYVSVTVRLLAHPTLAVIDQQARERHVTRSTVIREMLFYAVRKMPKRLP